MLIKKGKVYLTVDSCVLDRFWLYVDKTKNCWNWTGASRREYGLLTIAGHTVAAHRISYLIHNSSLDDDKCICHKCDNTRCVNPCHLFQGTIKENMSDMTSKGRSSGQKKTHCKMGHLLSGLNVVIKKRSNGSCKSYRACRTCLRVLDKKYKLRKIENAKHGIIIFNNSDI